MTESPAGLALAVRSGPVPLAHAGPVPGGVPPLQGVSDPRVSSASACGVRYALRPGCEWGTENERKSGVNGGRGLTRRRATRRARRQRTGHDHEESRRRGHTPTRARAHETETTRVSRLDTHGVTCPSKRSEDRATATLRLTATGYYVTTRAHGKPKVGYPVLCLYVSYMQHLHSLCSSCRRSARRKRSRRGGALGGSTARQS